jgi:tripartite-type tricarboxylate transporter receptor subunit TctC
MPSSKASSADVFSTDGLYAVASGHPIESPKVIHMHRFVLAAVLALSSAVTHAQNAPRPVRILVPFAAGGASDTYSRLAALKINEQTGKAFVVENRTGAGGRIAWEAAAKSAPDGTTIALIDATYPMLPGLFGSRLPWDVASDLVPAAMIAQTPFVITVSTQSKLKTLGELVAEARARPGKLNYGSSGVGGVNHVVTALFLHDAGIDLTHIPYKGMSDASVALQGGQVDLIVAASPTALGSIKGGKARALAVSTSRRSPALPGVPTSTEAGVGYVVTNWFGFAVPKGTSAAFIRTLRDDVVRATSAPDVKEKLAAQGAEPSAFTPEEFAKFLKEDTRRWTGVIESAGIKVEQ